MLWMNQSLTVLIGFNEDKNVLENDYMSRMLKMILS